MCGFTENRVGSPPLAPSAAAMNDLIALFADRVLNILLLLFLY